MKGTQQLDTLPDRLRDDSTNSGSLSDMVYNHLADQIIKGVVQYGDRLSTKTIAAELGVSPMPIRDALKRLEMEQVVVIRPRSTCYVRIPTKKMTLDAVDARRMIELFAIRQVYETVTTMELSTLEETVRLMERFIARTTGRRTRAAIDEYIELDRQFHTEICALARNDYVDRFYRETNMHLNMSFRYGNGVCHGVEETLRDHEAILTGLRENSVEAVSMLETHLLRSRENIQADSAFRMLEH